MDVRSLRWGLLLLLCWPLAAWAGNAGVRVTALPAAPVSMPAPPRAFTSGQGAIKPLVWLHAPRARTVWYALRLAESWQGASPPLLAIHGNMRARLTVYLPPDYRPRSDTVFDTTLDPTFSHRAVVYRLPRDLRVDQPIYVALGDPGQVQPIRIEVTDTTSYRAEDLWHIRISTFFVSVQLSMVLVILCFWLVLRDRMFLYFIAYAGAQVVYEMVVSGTLFVLPGAWLLRPLDFRIGQGMAALAVTFAIWFILEFAELRRYTPRLAAWLGMLRWPFLMAIGIFLIPWIQPEAWLPSAFNLLLVVSIMIVLASSWLAWRGSNRQAGFFLLSWVPLLTLAGARTLQLIVGLPVPEWLEYGFPASMAYAAVVMTVGLADRTLQVRHERDQATHLAQFDPLTGVYNRGAIMQRLREAWRTTAADAAPLAVLFLDIDHFKQINDSRGHAAGDACLRALTKAVLMELGEADCVGRYGGEEFLIVLRGGSATAAPRIAESIGARAAALRVPIGEHLLAFTVSIGVALRDASMANVEALVECADAAQYSAKAAGRDQVVAYRRGAVAAALAARHPR